MREIVVLIKYQVVVLCVSLVVIFELRCKWFVVFEVAMFLSLCVYVFCSWLWWKCKSVIVNKCDCVFVYSVVIVSVVASFPSGVTPLPICAWLLVVVILYLVGYGLTVSLDVVYVCYCRVSTHVWGFWVEVWWILVEFLAAILVIFFDATPFARFVVLCALMPVSHALSFHTSADSVNRVIGVLTVFTIRDVVILFLVCEYLCVWLLLQLIDRHRRNLLVAAFFRWVVFVSEVIVIVSCVVYLTELDVAANPHMTAQLGPGYSSNNAGDGPTQDERKRQHKESVTNRFRSGGGEKTKVQPGPKVCRDFVAGTCTRVGCKFAHQLPPPVVEPILTPQELKAIEAAEYQAKCDLDRVPVTIYVRPRQHEVHHYWIELYEIFKWLTIVYVLLLVGLRALIHWRGIFWSFLANVYPAAVRALLVVYLTSFGIGCIALTLVRLPPRYPEDRSHLLQLDPIQSRPWLQGDNDFNFNSQLDYTFRYDAVISDIMFKYLCSEMYGSSNNEKTLMNIRYALNKYTNNFPLGVIDDTACFFKNKLEAFELRNKMFKQGKDIGIT